MSSYFRLWATWGLLVTDLGTMNKSHCPASCPHFAPLGLCPITVHKLLQFISHMSCHYHHSGLYFCNMGSLLSLFQETFLHHWRQGQKTADRMHNSKWYCCGNLSYCGRKPEWGRNPRDQWGLTTQSIWSQNILHKSRNCDSVTSRQY